MSCKSFNEQNFFVLFMQKLKQIFEEGLERQKAHLREQRAYSKEVLQENYRKYQDEIEAMENYYRDQVKTVCGPPPMKHVACVCSIQLVFKVAMKSVANQNYPVNSRFTK